METLNDIMTTNVMTVDLDASIESIQEIFDQHRFHHVLVVDQRKLVGVISDRDLLKHMSPFLGSKWMERGQDLNTLQKKAHQIMHRHLVTATPDTSLMIARDLILENNVTCLPVVDEFVRVCGIITWRDLLPACFTCTADEDGEQEGAENEQDREAA